MGLFRVRRSLERNLEPARAEKRDQQLNSADRGPIGRVRNHDFRHCADPINHIRGRIRGDHTTSFPNKTPT